MAPRETEKMLMQNFGVTNNEHYGMLWYFMEWSIATGITKCNDYYKLRQYNVTIRPPDGLSSPQAYQCKITQSTAMATQMQLEVILAVNRIATGVL